MDETLRYIQEPSNVPLLEAPKWWHRFYNRKGAFILGIIPLVMVVSLYFFFISAPKDFPIDRVYSIQRGETLSGIAANFEFAHMVRSATVFKILVKIFAPRSGALAGDYEFDNRQNAITLAWRIANGSYELKLERVTIPEGLNSNQIADIFAKNKKFYAFKPQDFRKEAAQYEGYLFPDTYLFLPNVTAAQVVTVMTNIYQDKILALQKDITTFGKKINDVITMASILEEEGRTMETRQMIAGILWKRLDKGMALQVDASIVYLTGKKSGNELVQDDFRIKSPYNTYLNKGLPPTPISNPGIAAIAAAIHPTPSNYYFYITDPEGVFHGAATYEQQLLNQQKYLK